MPVITYPKQNTDYKLVGKSCLSCNGPIENNNEIVVHRLKLHREYYHPTHKHCLDIASRVISKEANCIKCREPYDGYKYNPSKIKTFENKEIKPRLK